MAFSADRQIFLLLVITAEFLGVLFFLQSVYFTEGSKLHGGCRDFVTKKIVFLFCGDTPAFVFYLPVNELISFD